MAYMCVYVCAETASRMVVTWVTFDPTETSEVRYGLKGVGLIHNATGTVTKFVDKGLLSETTRYIHRANMTDLLPLSSYGTYSGQWSRVWSIAPSIPAPSAGQAVWYIIFLCNAKTLIYVMLLLCKVCSFVKFAVV